MVTVLVIRKTKLRQRSFEHLVDVFCKLRLDMIALKKHGWSRALAVEYTIKLGEDQGLKAEWWWCGGGRCRGGGVVVCT